MEPIKDVNSTSQRPTLHHIPAVEDPPRSWFQRMRGVHPAPPTRDHEGPPSRGEESEEKNATSTGVGDSTRCTSGTKDAVPRSGPDPGTPMPPLNQEALLGFDAESLSVKTSTETEGATIFTPASTSVAGTTRETTRGEDTETNTVSMTTPGSSSGPSTIRHEDEDKHPAVAKAPHVGPFSLLPRENVKSLRQIISEAASQCEVKIDAIEDLYPCTEVQERAARATINYKPEPIIKERVTKKEPIRYPVGGSKKRGYKQLREAQLREEQLAEDQPRQDSINPGVIDRFVYELDDNIDLDRFKKAWADVWTTSPILRTRCFKLESSMTGAFLLAVVRDEPQWFTAGKLDAYEEADNARHMPLGSRMNRFAIIIDLDSGTPKYFVWTMHHMFHDVTTINLIMQQLSSTYTNLEVPIATDFRQFVAHVQDRAARPLPRTVWDAWSDGTDTSSVSPPSTDVKSYHQWQECEALKREVDCAGGSGEGAERCEHQVLTKYLSTEQPTIIRTAWAIMLAYYFNTDEVIFGETVSGRNCSLPGIETVQGPTSVTVPTRICLPAHLSAWGLMDHVDLEYSGTAPFQDCRLDRDMRDYGEFQSVLVMQQQDAKVKDTDIIWCFCERCLMRATGQRGQREGRRKTHGIEEYTKSIGSLCESSFARRGYSKWPMVCTVADSTGSGVELHVEANPNIIPVKFATAILDTVGAIVDQLVGLNVESTTTVGDIIRGLRVKETYSRQPLPRAVRSESPYNIAHAQTSIHGLVFNRRPAEMVAVWSSEVSWSYRRLDELSSALALHLISLGVKKGDVIPLFFVRSVWSAVAMLGVLKAGAAFAVVDTNINCLKSLQDKDHAHIPVVLKDSEHIFMSNFDQLDFEPLGLPVLSVDAETMQSLDVPGPGQLPDVSPCSLAYITYSSNHGDYPACQFRGVKISHGAFASSSIAYGRTMSLGRHPRGAHQRAVLHHHGTYDENCLNEVLTTLIWGGKICVPTDDELFADLARTFVGESETELAIISGVELRKGRSTVALNAFPAVKTMDLRMDRTRSSLAYGTEIQYQASPAQLSHTGENLVLVYKAPGANGTGVAFMHYPRGSKDIDLNIMGQPLGCLTWIVDPDDHNILITERNKNGELLLEGPGLASGCIASNKTSASPFVFDPAWAQSTASDGNHEGRRMYKTGDLVFLNDKNELVYVGRKGDAT